MEYPALEDVKKRVEVALDIFRENDLFLLENNLNERSISHKFAVYLGSLFKEWDVDCEYNRDHYKVKTVDLPVENTKSDDTKAKTVFPDIIIHRRNENDNLLAIEIKKSNNLTPQFKKFDLDKLGAYQTDLRYKYTLFIVFHTQVIGTAYYEEEWNPNRNDNFE